MLPIFKGSLLSALIVPFELHSQGGRGRQYFQAFFERRSQPERGESKLTYLGAFVPPLVVVLAERFAGFSLMVNDQTAPTKPWFSFFIPVRIIMDILVVLNNAILVNGVATQLAKVVDFRVVLLDL